MGCCCGTNTLDEVETRPLIQNRTSTTAPQLPCGLPAPQPQIQVAQQLAFGRFAVATTTSRTVQVSNVGNASLTVSALVRGGQDADQFAVQNAPQGPVVIPAGQSAPLTLAFSPTSAGDKVAQITLSSDDPNTPQSVIALTGRAEVRLLQMHLDEDRDGAVDGTPAACANWQWGAQARGAVIMVKTRIPLGPGPQFAPNAQGVVLERCPIELRWTGAVPNDAQNWTATLAVDRPAVVRLYPTNLHGAVALVAQNGTYDLTQRLVNQQTVTLWIEAVTFRLNNGQYSATENHWRVLLTFTFTDQGQATQQQSQVRVAPWLMASDLEPTAYLGYKGYPALENNPYSQRMPASLTAHLPNGCASVTAKPSDPNNPKAFARDVQKAGFVTAPHQSMIVSMVDLDDQSPISTLPRGMARQAAHLGTFRPHGGDEQIGGQSGGGNFLVSPPRPGHPFGRMIYGESALRPCEVSPFFNAQRYMAPIVLDSSWLHVGHVDEYLSFLPDPTNASGWNHKVLIASARLAHAICYLCEAQPAAQNLDNLLDLAAQLSEVARLAGQALIPTQTLAQHFGQLPQPQGAAAQVARQAGYVENPAVPQNTDGMFVRWSDGANFDVEPARTYLADQQGHDVAWLQYATRAQTGIDTDRGVLAQALNVTHANFIEIPVLFGTDIAGVNARSADSVNMLILTNAGTCCIVPKPFGPVIHGTYAFERCIERRLAPFGNPTLHFVNDWEDLHIHDGEIHCGTNQVPALRALRWWENAP